MAYPKLKETLDKSQYEKYNGKKVTFKGKVVEVYIYRSSGNRLGSYERGLKWSHARYGCLIRNKTKSTITISANHGKTWGKYYSSWKGDAAKGAVRDSKNKVVLATETEKEFAFEGIQEINRKWDGPGYRWRR